MSDRPELALHTVHVDPNHPTGGSAHFPQRKLGAAGSPAVYEGVRARMARMVGAGGSLRLLAVALPDGKPIPLTPGKRYSILASVRKKHSLRALAVRAGAWGAEIEMARDEVSPEEFGVAPAPEDYRLVHLVGRSKKAVTMPWGTPGFMRVLGEKSTVVKAWMEDGMAEGAGQDFELRRGDPPEIGAGGDAGGRARGRGRRCVAQRVVPGTGRLASACRAISPERQPRASAC